MAAGQSSLYARVLTALGVGQAQKVAIANADTDTVVPLSQTLEGRLRTDAYIEQLVETNRLLTLSLMERGDNSQLIMELLGRRGAQPAADSLPVIVSPDQAAVGVTSRDVVVSGVINVANANATVGLPTEGSTLVIRTEGLATVGIQVTGTFSLTLQVHATIDGTTWVALQAGNGYLATNSTGSASSISLAGISLINVAGFSAFRVSCSAYVSGKALVTLRGTARGDVGAQIGGSQLSNGGVTVTSVTTQLPATNTGQLSPLHLENLTVSNIKTTAGNLYGLVAVNLSAALTWIQFYNNAGAPSLGTSVVWSVPVPASGSLVIHPGPYALAFFGTGIAVGAATTATGSGAPVTAPDVTVFYK